MDQGKPSEFDSLAAEIDSAVEDLFGSYTAPQAPVVNKPAPPAPPPPPKPAPQQTAPAAPRPAPPQQPAPQQPKPAAPQPPGPLKSPPAPPATAQPQKPASALDAEIDKAVEELFGAYETKKPTPAASAPQAAPQPSASPQPGPASSQPAQQAVPAKQAPAEIELQIETQAPKPAPAAAKPESDLSSEIDRAVEDLFGAYETPKPAAAPALSQQPPPKSAPRPAEPAKPVPATEIEIEPVAAPDIQAPAPPQTAESVSSDTLWELFDQAILTIDWEVTSTNVRSAKRILDQIRSQLQLDAQEPLKQVVVLMDQILQAMSRSPENVPTSGPLALKEGTQALKSSYEDLNDATRQLLSHATQTLEAALPQMPATEGAAERLSGAAATLQLHERFLAKAIKNISSFENLFAQNPSFQKLLAAESNLRSTFQNRHEQIVEMLQHQTSSGMQHLLPQFKGTLENHIAVLNQCLGSIQPLITLFSKKEAHKKLYLAHQSLQSTVEKHIGQLHALLTAQPPTDEIEEISIPVEEITLEPVQDDEAIPSIATMSGVEEVALPADHEIPTLSAVDAVDITEPQIADSEPGVPSSELLVAVQSHIAALDKCKNNLLPLENLFSKPGHEKLRTTVQGVREELDSQMVLLARTISGDYQSPPASVMQTMQGYAGPGKKQTCPWKNLITAEWRGQTVAFIPSEVAYEVKAAGWLKKMREKLVTLPLKKLRPHFWNKLGPLFRGEMKFLGETYLKHMQVPLLNYVAPLRSTQKLPKKPILLILFSEGYSGAVFLDSATQNISISNSWGWEPITQRGSTLAGYLTVKGKSMPVITIARLESLP